MPVYARPFFLSGPQATTVAPFLNVQVPGLSLEIAAGQIAIIKLLNVWKIRGGTLDAPAAGSFWTVLVDGVPIGDGYEAIYTFGIGSGIPGLSGLFLWNTDIRITQVGTVTVQVTIEDPNMAGSSISVAGMMQGYTYSEALETELDNARDAAVEAAQGGVQ